MQQFKTNNLWGKKNLNNTTFNFEFIILQQNMITEN
jgi:hypothetical protein